MPKPKQSFCVYCIQSKVFYRKRFFMEKGEGKGNLYQKTPKRMLFNCSRYSDKEGLHNLNKKDRLID